MPRWAVTWTEIELNATDATFMQIPKMSDFYQNYNVNIAEKKVKPIAMM